MLPSELLTALSEMSDENADLFWAGLNAGMWDEWDCGINGWDEVGFGGPELRIAAKTGMYFARAHEEDEECEHDWKPLEGTQWTSECANCGKKQ